MSIYIDKTDQLAKEQQPREQLHVVLTGDSEQALEWLDAILAPVVEIQTRRIQFHSNDELSQLYQQPADVIILRLGNQPEQQLDALKSLTSSLKTTLVVIGPSDQPLLMRAAMRSGAKDYLPEPFSNQELLSLLESIFETRLATLNTAKARVTAVISASGGAGATFLACNLAHIMASKQHNTLLLDLNTQLGSVMQFMDLHGDYGLEDVLEELQHSDKALDQTALTGYLSQHDSGLRVLAMKQPDLLAESTPDTGQLLRLLKLLKQGRDEVIIDLPMLPANTSTFIQEQADEICLVLQQDMLSLRNALRWLDLAESQLGLARERFTIVVNRYHRRLPIRLEDIQSTLKVSDIVTIPGDYNRVSDSLNTGTPLLSHAPRASVTKAVVSLHTRFSEQLRQPSRLTSIVKKLFK